MDSVAVKTVIQLLREPKKKKKKDQRLDLLDFKPLLFFCLCESVTRTKGKKKKIENLTAAH